MVGEIEGLLVAVVFAETVSHSQMRPLFDAGIVMSAGFCHFNDRCVSVYGESVGLGLKSNPDVDEVLVGRAMSHPAYVR